MHHLWRVSDGDASLREVVWLIWSCSDAAGVGSGVYCQCQGEVSMLQVRGDADDSTRLGSGREDHRGAVGLWKAG